MKDMIDDVIGKKKEIKREINGNKIEEKKDQNSFRLGSKFLFSIFKSKDKSIQNF